MKNLKRFFTILEIVFLAGKIFAAKNDFLDFAISANFGLLNGTVKEYVFYPESYNADDVLSRLDWEVKNIPVFDFRADAILFKYGFLGAEGFFAIPKSSGTMQDYDWLNCASFNLPKEFGTQITNYSCHENFLKKYGGFTVKIGANLFILFDSEIFSARVAPFLAWQYEIIGFDGKNGYRSYKEEDWRKISFSGNVISYFQETNSFLCGVDFSFFVFDILGVSGDFSLSPNASYINAVDFHYLTKTAYLDKLNETFLLKANLKADYFFLKRHKIFVQGFFQYVPMQKGPDYKRNINSNGAYASSNWIKESGVEGGTQKFLIKISLGYGFDLF